MNIFAARHISGPIPTFAPPGGWPFANVGIEAPPENIMAVELLDLTFAWNVAAGGVRTSNPLHRLITFRFRALFRRNLAGEIRR